MTGIWKSLAIATVAFVLANIFLYSPTTDSSKHAFQKKYLRLIKKSKPKIVMLGNSMLRAAVDIKQFSNAVDRKSIKIAVGGSESAAWYLTLKNITLKVRKKPSYVVIFFRDYYLTMPEYRVQGRYEKHIRDLCSKSEPLVEKLSYGTDRWEMFLAHAIPLYRNRLQTTDRLDTWIKKDVISHLLGEKAEFAQKAVNSVFNNKNMDLASLTAKQLAAESAENVTQTDFSAAVKNSYLPAMIEEAKKAKVNLLFVRVKRRRDASGEQQSDALRQYIHDLSRYLSKKKIPFIDFTHERQILLKHFADGDHLSSKSGRPLFTSLLVKRILPYISKKPAAINRQRNHRRR